MTRLTGRSWPRPNSARSFRHPLPVPIVSPNGVPRLSGVPVPFLSAPRPRAAPGARPASRAAAGRLRASAPCRPRPLRALARGVEPRLRSHRADARRAAGGRVGSALGRQAAGRGAPPARTASPAAAVVRGVAGGAERAGWTIDPELVEVRVEATSTSTDRRSSSPAASIASIATRRRDRVCSTQRAPSNPVTPEQAHRARRRSERCWTLLQLPLYQLMLRQRGVTGAAGRALELGSSTLGIASVGIRWRLPGGARTNSPMRARARGVVRAVRAAGSGRPVGRRRSPMGSRVWSATPFPTALAT